MVFDKFTDQARRAVVLASDAALTDHHDHLGTEHLLLALIDNRSSAGSQILDEAGPASLEGCGNTFFVRSPKTAANPIGRARPTSPPYG